MAFCTRSERSINFTKKDIYPGPGQYIKLSPKLILNNKRKFPPFFTSAKRASFIISNNIPGPGSYNLDKKYQHQSLSNNSKENEENNFQELVTNYNSNNSGNISTAYHFSKYSINTNNTPIKNNSFLSKDQAIQSKHFKLYKSTNNKFIGNNIGFLSQKNRFEENNKKNDINIPGPGSYCDSILSFSSTSKNDNKIKKKIKKGKILENCGILNRIVSIPSKTMNGYIFHFNNNEDNNINNKSLSNSFNGKSKNIDFFGNSENVNEKSHTLHNYSFSNLIINNTINNNNNNKTFQNNINYNNNSDNKLKLLLNERKFTSTANTTTSEFIGPGSYDVSFIKKNKKGINWSKGFDLEKISKKKSTQKQDELISELKKNGDTIYTRKNFDKNINLKKAKLNKNKILLLYNLHKIKDNILQNKINNDFRSSFIPDKSEIPGPGYYEKSISPSPSLKKGEKEIGLNENNKLNTLIKKKPNLNFIKYLFTKIKINKGFGSHCDYYMNRSKSLEDLGPFTYFKDKNKYDPGKKNNLYKRIILGKTDMSKTNYINYDFNSPDLTEDSLDNDDINFDTNLINEIQAKAKDNNKTKVENLKLQNTISNFTTESEKNLFKKLDKDSKNFFSKLNHIPLVDLDKYKYIYSNPGPGDYNLSHKFLIPSFSSSQMMNSKTKRFINLSKNDTPGPGAYSIGTKKNIIIKKIVYKKSKIDAVKEQKIKKIIEKKETPGVGYYNLDKRNSIIYKLRTKYNQHQSYYSPFLLSSSRFNHPKIDYNISSGDYEPYKYENIKKNNQYMIFNKSNRFHKLNELKIGPGSYNIDVEWNKKSFNRLFSGNDLLD